MRTTKLIFSIAILVLGNLNTFGQAVFEEENIESLQSSKEFLRNYRPPNYRFTSLLIKPAFSESSNVTETLSRSSMDIMFDSRLIFRQLRDKSTTNFQVNLDESFRKRIINDIKNANDNFYNHDIYAYGQHDYYLKEKLFLGTGVSYSGDFERSLVEDWTIDQSNGASLLLGVGFGRIFSVNRAWMAQSLLNDLECNGIAVDRSQLTDLSDLLVMQQNRRIFDSRLNRIKRRTELHTFIRDNQIAEFSPLSAALLEDTFRFENFRNRLTGFRLYVGFSPSVRNTKERVIDDEQKNTSYSINPFLDFDYHLPISEDWQFDVFNSLYSADLLTENGERFLSVRSSFSLAWLPNLRIRSSLTLNYRGSFSENNIYNGLNLGYNLNYYFSPRMVGNFEAIIGNNWSETLNQVQTDFSQRISFGLSYYLL